MTTRWRIEFGQADHRVWIAKIEFVQDIGKAQVAQFLIDHEAHRSLVAMADEKDDAFHEALVRHIGHGDEKLAFKRFHAAIVCRYAARCQVPMVRAGGHHEGMMSRQLFLNFVLR